jgi:hypothetical protein
MAKRTRWERHEIRTLEWYIGTKPLYKIAELLDRTLAAVKNKAKRLGARATKGNHTLNGLVRETGFDYRQLYKARDALKQRWKRANKSQGAYTITDDQLADLLAYLFQPAQFVSRDGQQQDVWAIRAGLYSCIRCGASGTSSEEIHWAHGICTACYRTLVMEKAILKRYNSMACYLKFMKQENIAFSGQMNPIEQVIAWTCIIKARVIAFVPFELLIIKLR